MGRWLRHNLFRDPVDGVISVALAATALFCLSIFVEWSLINAVWRANSLDECQAIIAATRGENASGACWAVIGSSFNAFALGPYPRELCWRPALVAVFAALVVATAFFRRSSRIAAALALAFPFVSSWLVWGGYGLAPVASPLVGGFILVLMVATLAAPVAFAAGFALALGRRCLILPARAIAAALIATLGAIPPIVLLFAGMLFSLLMLPAGAFIDLIALTALLLGFATAAPVAQVMGNSLARVPDGVGEAARSLGFSRRGGFWLVIAPQALGNAAPQLAMIGARLVRDSSLVFILGVLDPIGLISTHRADARWNGVVWELFLVVGGAYWIVSFAITSLGKRLERRSIQRCGGDPSHLVKAAGAPVALS